MYLCDILPEKWRDAKKAFFCFILKSKSPISRRRIGTMTTLILFVYVCMAYAVLSLHIPNSVGYCFFIHFCKAFGDA